MLELLEILATGMSLTEEQTSDAFEAIMTGGCSDVEIAALLTALRVRGETFEELVGAARTMRAKVQNIQHGVAGLLDTCGTGGDHCGTFNISTAAAIVASACGAPVAKHGNRSVSSPSGSADVLSALGVPLDVPVERTAECLRSIGLAFFFAPNWHPAMKHVVPVRRALRFRTIFNLLGPLANPAGAEYQLLGVGKPVLADKMAQAILRLGTRSSTVVCGGDGLDEVTLAESTHAVIVRNGEMRVETWTPASFELPTYHLDDWKVHSVEQSAAVIRGVLDGERGPARDIVLANAAAALWTAERVENLPAGVAQAASAIDQGRAKQQLDELVRRSKLPIE